ncbi:MAG TPA: cobalamin-dependent protein [Candidatus Blautia gallistercoris]|uniref:Cobalamin-dependent protein n=1 Tax=Candidatus Blautia gallistercoris TaxID=2838490 RepID=A0A9D1WH24_9FIRM|nr:cobalamin-dependent protein [Candidatus Blautia gallistercoris]
MTLERIRTSIINGFYKDALELTRQALEEQIPADIILEEGLVPAMRQVEELYKQEILSIPNILASARCMKKGLEILQPCLETPDYHPIAKVILGTVKGDLHDMGKNLVAIMFRSNGFEVIDLGVDVSDRQFLTAIRENPDAELVCISSLLTTTLKEMQHIVRSIRRYDTGHHLKIMVGGAPVTQEFADSIGADGYTENAMDAAKMARSFFVPED